MEDTFYFYIICGTNERKLAVAEIYISHYDKERNGHTKPCR